MPGIEGYTARLLKTRYELSRRLETTPNEALERRLAEMQGLLVTVETVMRPVSVAQGIGVVSQASRRAAHGGLLDPRGYRIR